ncbi:uncharacterized protein cubi_02060 [Cryptosporidium ubiquitum]|uniref:Beta-catenin-like protein 1 N-terminal domain-containing protein n=1 Tax=Cryptosporidium ubiquitum TaxID=857276 RepID=A0A1J4MQ22_9CRYT|nr:uncharacterized protein cubi_02060 [Cryptosporidium ubiquitum]OII75539.1 hypothetical protein cubi_02060 [Cryptosporidium ubiquitum]
MKLEKRTRSITDTEDLSEDNGKNKKINRDDSQGISEILGEFKKYIKDFEVEKMYFTLEKINQKEILLSDIEDLITFGFSEMIKESLEKLNYTISLTNDTEENEECGKVLNGLKIKIFKLILNVLLDISEFQDGSSQIGNQDINTLKLKLLLEDGLTFSLLKTVRNIENMYLRNLKAESIFSKKSQDFGELIDHENELLQESILETYFQFLESTIEIDPKKVSKEFTNSEGLFEWLMQIFDNDESFIVDEITSLKMEILSIIFQYIKVSQISTNGINIDKKEVMDKFLVKLATFGLRDGEIGGIKEKEFVHNIVDIICNSLFEEDMRKEFNDLQGLELMVKLIEEKAFMRPLSVKILSFALIDKGEMSNKFIQISGLKLVFALLAHSSKNLTNNEKYIKNRQQQDTDEHLCSIIKSLLQFSTGNDHEMLINKLIENNYLKLKNFLVLRKYYSNKITQALESSQDLQEEDEEQIEIIETIAIDAGLFIVQLIDLIIVYTIYYEKGDINDFEKNVLSKNGVHLDDLKTSIEDYSNSLNQDEKVFNEKILLYLNS